MKMSKERFEELREAVLPVMRARPYSVYRDAGLSEMRWRWDALWATGEIAGMHRADWVGDFLYRAEDLNDTHIDTALRAIAREV